MSDEYEGYMTFPDDHPSFCHGLEAGLLWDKMEKGEDIHPDERVLPTANLEMITRMCKWFGYKMEAAPNGVEGWSDLTFTKLGENG